MKQPVKGFLNIHIDSPFKFRKSVRVLRVERDTIKVCEVKETSISRGFLKDLFCGRKKLAYHFNGKRFTVQEL